MYVVYLAHDPERKRVKIGYSSNVGRRFYSLNGDFPGLVLVGYRQGSFRTEKAMHARFKKYTDPLSPGKEWFSDSILPDLRCEFSEPTPEMVGWKCEAPSIRITDDLVHERVKLFAVKNGLKIGWIYAAGADMYLQRAKEERPCRYSLHWWSASRAGYWCRCFAQSRRWWWNAGRPDTRRSLNPSRTPTKSNRAKSS